MRCGLPSVLLPLSLLAPSLSQLLAPSLPPGAACPFVRRSGGRVLRKFGSPAMEDGEPDVCFGYSKGYGPCGECKDPNPLVEDCQNETKKRAHMCHFCFGLHRGVDCIDTDAKAAYKEKQKAIDAAKRKEKAHSAKRVKMEPKWDGWTGDSSGLDSSYSDSWSGGDRDWAAARKMAKSELIAEEESKRAERKLVEQAKAELKDEWSAAGWKSADKPGSGSDQGRGAVAGSSDDVRDYIRKWGPKPPKEPWKHHADWSDKEWEKAYGAADKRPTTPPMRDGYRGKVGYDGEGPIIPQGWDADTSNALYPIGENKGWGYKGPERIECKCCNKGIHRGQLTLVKNENRKNPYKAVADFGSCGNPECTLTLQARVDAENTTGHVWSIRSLFEFSRARWWKNIEEEKRHRLQVTGGVHGAFRQLSRLRKEITSVLEEAGYEPP